MRRFMCVICLATIFVSGFCISAALGTIGYIVMGGVGAVAGMLGGIAFTSILLEEVIDP